MSTDVPFRRQTIYLKQVSTDVLTDIEAAALQFLYPGYHEGSGFAEAQPHPESPMGLLKASGHSVMADMNQHRRYAGDFSLPRSRYYTVCRDQMGDDGGLMLRELQAYSKPQDYGHIEVIDTTSPAEEVASIRAMLKPGTSALFCIPIDYSHFPSAARARFDPKGLANQRAITLVIPTQLKTETFERLIDLRDPLTRQWFVSTFTRLVSEVEPHLPFFPLAGPLDEFDRLLPTLLAQGLGGGGGATQAAGSWLRRLGADGLIFPSARADVSVTVINNEVKDWYGWNLVDYRGAPKPTMQDFIILSPEWDRYPTTLHHDLTTEPMSGEGGPPAVEFTHVKVVSSNSGPHWGGLKVQGIELARAMYHTFALWTHYTNAMGPGLGADVLELSMLVASDGNRGIHMDRMAMVAGAFLHALGGDEEAKLQISKFATLPQIEDGNRDAVSTLNAFLALCD